MLDVSVEKISGRPSESVVCTILKKTVNVADSGSGTLVSCILAAGEGVAPEIISDIFEIAQKKLEGGDDGVLSSLKSALEASRNYNTNLVISFIHCFFFDDVCYIVRFGERVKLFVFAPPKSLEITFESGSGPAEAGQMYLLASDAFLSIFDTSVFANDADVDFADIIDGIATEIAGEENQAEIGAAFVSISGTEIQRDRVGEGRDDVEAAEVGEETLAIESTEVTVDGDVSTSVEETSAIVAVAEQNVDTPADVPDENFQLRQAPDARRVGLARFKFNPLSVVGWAISSNFQKIKSGDISVIRKNIVIIAVVIFLILGASVGFALYKKSQSEKNIEFNTHFSAASTKFNEANAIFELNRSRSRDILIDAEGEAKLALSVLPRDEKAQKLEADISSKLKDTNVASNVNFEQVASVGDGVKSLGFSGKNLVTISADKLFVVNTASGKVDKVNGQGNVISGIVYDNKAFVLSEDKVYKEDLVGGKISAVGTAAGGLDVSVFFGNVYVLTTDSILKFLPVESGYSNSTQYLDKNESFGADSHFSIDSSVWVTSGSKILKFTRGKKEDFGISGLSGGSGNLSLIYTSADLDNLYVLDSTNSAVLVIGKDGSYKKVLQSGEFSGISDLIVDSDEKTLYVAKGDKILKATL
ncbi:MAG TPA: hypothetical protein VLE91_02255 [Candidatus Saccharimonadales bacterium]|nr:hypothetical protein [Candidatus Saccharimonadales bacterium]